MVMYSMLDHSEAIALLGKLGRHTTGKGCLYIKKLADVDRTVLETLIKSARPLPCSHGHAFLKATTH